MADKPMKDDDQWRDELDSQAFHICREKGTERAFTGAYWDTKTEGVYRCRCCDEILFSSDTKYDSGSGWPSFYQPVEGDVVETESDTSLGMSRTEVHCKKCGSHLGHVFTDGPQPTGLRYCVNSASLRLQEKE